MAVPPRNNITVYVGPALYAELRRYPQIKISAVCRRALIEEIRRLDERESGPAPVWALGALS